MSTNRKIAKASAILIAASSLGYVLSLFKEIMVANYFGITKAMDAFYAAVAIPNLFSNVILAAFGAVFIPIYVRYRLKDAREADRIASVVVNYLFLALVSASLLLFIAAPYIVEFVFHGLSAETVALAVRILRILCATVVLSGMIGIMTGILNSHEHFSAPAFTQMVITATTILFIALFVGRWGVFVLPWGLLAGLMVQFLILVPVVMGKGYRHRLSLDWRHSAIREMTYLSLLLFMSMFAGQMNVVVDRVMASYLAPGSIAALGYADKLVQVPTMIFSASIAAAVFPFFSAQAAENRIEEMKNSLAKSIRMSGCIFMPLTVMLVILAKPVIQVLFQRGAFGPQATELTTAILVCYSFQLFFYGAVLILARVYLVFQDMVTLLKLTGIGVALNVLLNLVFMRLVTPPAAGIALATSAVYCITMSLMLVLLRKKMIHLGGSYILDGLARAVVCSVVTGAATYAVLGLSQHVAFATPELTLAARTAAAALGGIIAFVASAHLLGIEEPRKVMGLLYGKIR
jgi:putative peptidoglycan lipid II flippase